MKVSGIYPVFTSADIEREVKGYESLGFKTKHHLHETEQVEIYVMETENGSRLDLLNIVGAKPGCLGVRINVDDLEEAVKLYRSLGFTGGEKVFETSSNKITEMRAPHNDAMYIVVQHVKD